MNINSLNSVVQKWFKKQSDLPHGVSVVITVTSEQVVVSKKTGMLLSQILNEARSKAIKTNVYTSMMGVMSHELSSHDIAWDQATLSDFIKVFPNQSWLGT